MSDDDMEPLVLPRVTHTPEEWEAIAIRFRAICGIVPLHVWNHLTEGSRRRVGELNQEAANRVVTGLTAPSRAPVTRTAHLLNPGPAATVDLGLDMQYVPVARSAIPRRPRQRPSLEAFKAHMLATIELTQGVAAGSVPVGYADAIRALPDRMLLLRMPMDIQTFIERELADIEVSK